MRYFFLILFFVMLIGCNEESVEKTPDCEEGKVYNPHIEECVVDFCKDPNSPENLGIATENFYCAAGCVYKDDEEQFKITCNR